VVEWSCLAVMGGTQNSVGDVTRLHLNVLVGLLDTEFIYSVTKTSSNHCILKFHPLRTAQDCL
jgi:hypothetical protein